VSPRGEGSTRTTHFLTGGNNPAEVSDGRVAFVQQRYFQGIYRASEKGSVMTVGKTNHSRRVVVTTMTVQYISRQVYIPVNQHHPQKSNCTSVIVLQRVSMRNVYSAVVRWRRLSPCSSPMVRDAGLLSDSVGEQVWGRLSHKTTAH